jgi:predicted transcriptional regulator
MTAEEKRKELVAEVIRLRQEQGLTQKQLEELSGVKQPIIARMETGANIPQLSTVIKLLVPLGKTLAVVPLENK